MKCHICNNDKITHYKQQRKDKVWVVTARCANGHIPEKGKPFYPIANFNLDALPEIGKAPPPPARQLSWEEQLRKDYSNEHKSYRNYPQPIEES